jgi:hypothetical protein
MPPFTTVAQPAASGVSLWLIAALALGVWYAYRQGWFHQALESLGLGAE